MENFKVTKAAKGWVVTGMMTVGGKIAAECYYHGFKYKKDAEADAAAMEKIEEEARQYAAEIAAAEAAEKAAKRAAREARKAEAARQLSLF